jgi:hypothetical protein
LYERARSLGLAVQVSAQSWPGLAPHDEPAGCQRLLVGRRAHLMEPGGMMTRASAMLAADVAAIGRQEAT